MPHVPGRDRGHPEAPGRMHAHRRAGHGDQDERDVGEGGGGPGGDARIHPREPPARLPGLRQGRRVPAPGPDLPSWTRQHPDDLPEAHGRQADPRVAAHRARPRALHPLLSLHALLGGRRRGRAAHRAQPRSAHRDSDLRGRAVSLTVLRERRRAVPRGRAHLDAVPLRCAAVGHPERPDRMHGLRRRLQHVGDDPRGQGQAHPLPQPPGGRPGLALRQGALLVPTSPCGGPHHDAAPPRAKGAPGDHRGTTPSTRPRRCSARRTARS